MTTYQTCPACGVEVPPPTLIIYDGRSKNGTFRCRNGHELTTVDSKKEKPQKGAKRTAH